MSVLTSSEPNSLDISCFIFSRPHHSPSLPRFTLGFLNTGLIFPFSVSDSPLLIFFFGSSSFFFFFFAQSLSIGIYEYSALVLFLTTSPQVISSSLMAPPITSSQITPESLTLAQNSLCSFASELSIVSWTLYENLHVLQPPHTQVVPNQKHYLFFLGKSLLPPPVFPLWVDDIKLGTLNSSYPFPLSLI